MRTKLAAELEDIDRRVMGLAPRAMAGYFACCAERLFPLYETFATKERWGDPVVLRVALELVWAAVGGSAPVHLAGQLALLEEQTPHADDFDNVLATFAQDVIGCIDLALMSLHEQVEAEAALNTFEAHRVAACLEQTGFLDLGSGPEADQFEEALIDDRRVQTELKLQHADLADLESSGGPDFMELRQRAIRNQWSLALLLPSRA